MTDGVQSHGLNKLDKHFLLYKMHFIADGPQITGMISVCIYEETTEVVAINWDVLERVGHGHNINGVE